MSGTASRLPRLREVFKTVARQALVLLIVVVTFGIFVPWYKGFTFLDPRIISAYACLALLFVAPASAELSAGQQSQMSIRALLSRIGTIVAFAWAITILVLATAFLTLNLVNRRGVLITPPWALCAALLSFSLAGSAVVAAASAVLARRISPAGVKSILRALFLLVLLVLTMSSRILPESWQIVLSGYTTRRAITRLAWQATTVAVVALCFLLILLLQKPRSVVTQETAPS